MLVSRKNNKKNKVLLTWIILLSVVLLFGNSIKLHVHDLSHSHDQQKSHNLVIGHGEHLAVARAHLSIDYSHSDHHMENAIEIDISPNALLKDLSGKVFALVLLSTLILLFLSGFYPFSFRRLHSNNVIFSRRYLLSPPLRAPPL
jgi:hypothetical protein